VYEREREKDGEIRTSEIFLSVQRVILFTCKRRTFLIETNV
jgi:hypothetical protein